MQFMTSRAPAGEALIVKIELETFFGLSLNRNEVHKMEKKENNNRTNYANIIEYFQLPHAQRIVIHCTLTRSHLNKLSDK